MTPEELVYASLSTVSELIRGREVSSVELTEIALARIERLNPLLNAFITVTAEQAQAEARQADAEIGAGDYRGPLHGVPYSLKDLVETAGVLTTAGSPILRDNVPSKNATVYRRLDAAGGVLLGKNAMLEFAYGSPHPDFGLTHNPWNLDYSTSGSSSGSAAAVAAGIGYGSIGSDTGGSIRIPASWCSLIGLKPTYGRVSLNGIIPLATSLDHVGPLTRTVRDAAILLGLMAGYDPHDPYSATVPVPDYVARLDEPLPSLRIGLDEQAVSDAVDPEIVSAVRRVVEALRSLKAEIVPVKLPDAVVAVDAASTTTAVEAAHYHRDWLTQQPSKYSEAVRRRLQRGLALSGVDFHEARRLRGRIRQEYEDLLQKVDLLVMPTTVVNPMTLEQVRAELTLPPSDPMNARIRFTSPINLIGFPAVSLPAGFTANGLPIGVQIVTRPFDEERLLAAADHLERELGFTARHPDLDRQPA